jgi:16S rRNA processing protein RimM
VTERVCVGRIGAPHGVRGEVRLQSFTGDPLAIADYGTLENKDGTRSFEIVSVRPAKNVLVARLKGVADRDAAEKLTNIELYIPRERLPPPDADEFYFVDLVGLTAVTADGATFGAVVAVHDFGAGTILELRPAGTTGSVMLPFTEATVPTVDIPGGRIVIDPPQELPKK